MNIQNITPLYNLHQLVPEINIIAGTPFLLVHDILVLSDLHIGQELTLPGHHPIVSNYITTLIKSIQIIFNKYVINKIIVTGDIKEHTNTITIEEQIDLEFFITQINANNKSIVFIKGNHDKYIENLLRKINRTETIVEYYKIHDCFLHHGHYLFPLPSERIIIIGHEHPAYVFKGLNFEKEKLPAFVTLFIQDKFVIILPSANQNAGVPFPPKDKIHFLSPFLREHGNLQSLQIYPYNNSIGILHLPKINNWNT
ncbi:MAG: metallophosphoesterase [Candidatus Heimdallarchaeota archaeon]|nr:metallophosphoesterase [Candidatus Heimdallarchaeota archaeon]